MTTNTLRFAKGQGTGNDFVLFSDPDGAVELTPQRVRALCDRHTGIGADGVIRAVRSRVIPEGTAVLQEEPEAEWFFDLWHADGTRGDMCGNGIRVFAHYLITEGLVAPERRDTLPIATRLGVRDVLAGASGYTVDMGRWRLGGEKLVSARGLYVPRPGLAIDLGGVHVVTALAHAGELEALDLNHEPTLNTGDTASFEFVVPDDTLVKNGVARIAMRVHEEGKGETRSSAAGAAAAALAFRHWGGDDMPHHWSVGVPGGRLAVRMFPTQEGEHVSLSGPAELVFTGEFELAAL